jgi:hypothetical protein
MAGGIGGFHFSTIGAAPDVHSGPFQWEPPEDTPGSSASAFWPCEVAIFASHSQWGG